MVSRFLTYFKKYRRERKEKEEWRKGEKKRISVWWLIAPPDTRAKAKPSIAFARVSGGHTSHGTGKPHRVITFYSSVEVM
jgi:hypothetical protein